MRRTSGFISKAGSPVSAEHTTVATVGEVRLNPQEQHQIPSTAWHSPVPYLFGGLAAMLGLIAFALLILACSYWKLSSFPEAEAEAESGAGDKAAGRAGKAAEEGRQTSNVVVIMAGQLKPTFLATPSTSRTSSFGDSVSSESGTHSIGIAMEASTSQGVGGEDQVRRGSSHQNDALHPAPAHHLPV